MALIEFQKIILAGKSCFNLSSMLKYWIQDHIIKNLTVKYILSSFQCLLIIDHIKRFWIKLLSSYKKVICLYLRSI